ncbi:MAG: hypothetical protein IJE97_08335, partial [Thermoguttaceae bacterium]|nr:hypothetical protein [Thermoguttaceae bacterium]
CQIAFERPGNLRVVGSAPTMGRVVDVGCNEERFWFWSDFQNSDELYFCRHDQYQNSAAARVLPLDPTWFPEAFGVVELKDDELVDGPTRQGDGSLLVTVKKARADGVYLKRVYFEPKTAAILRQDVQAPNGETIVSIRCKRSVYLDEPGVVLPQKLEIECPRADDALVLDMGTPLLNDSSKIAEKAFQQPTDLKAKAIDLGASQQAVAATAAATQPDANNAPVLTNNAAPSATPALADSTAVAAAFDAAAQTQVRMVARLHVDGVSPNAAATQPMLAAVPSTEPIQIPQASQTAQLAQTPQTAQNTPTFQTPQVAPNTPTFQTPQVAPNAQLAQTPQTAQNTPTFQTPQVAPNAQLAQETQTDLLEPPTLPADFPAYDVPAPVGPAQEIVGAPRAAL